MVGASVLQERSASVELERAPRGGSRRRSGSADGRPRRAQASAASTDTKLIFRTSTISGLYRTVWTFAPDRRIVRSVRRRFHGYGDPNEAECAAPRRSRGTPWRPSEHPGQLGPTGLAEGRQDALAARHDSARKTSRSCANGSTLSSRPVTAFPKLKGSTRTRPFTYVRARKRRLLLGTRQGMAQPSIFCFPPGRRRPRRRGSRRRPLASRHSGPGRWHW